MNSSVSGQLQTQKWAFTHITFKELWDGHNSCAPIPAPHLSFGANLETIKGQYPSKAIKKSEVAPSELYNVNCACRFHVSVKSKDYSRRVFQSSWLIIYNGTLQAIGSLDNTLSVDIYFHLDWDRWGSVISMWLVFCHNNTSGYAKRPILTL